MNIDDLLKNAAGIKLDIGCGAQKQGADWIGLDLQNIPGVDIVWDMNIHPWPLPDECVTTAICSHVLEHIPKVALDYSRPSNPTRFPLIEFMDEIWRVMKPDGHLAIAVPHGASESFIQDPTHASPLNEITFYYFDPLFKAGEAPPGYLYQFCKCKPWKIMEGPRKEPMLFYNPQGYIEIVLIKRRMDVSYE
jgi:hypothetical protein